MDSERHWCCLPQVATASQFFISYTIRTFGALTFATIMTTRQVNSKISLTFIIFHGRVSYQLYPYSCFWLKLVSIMLSCVWFSHPLSWKQWIGAVSHDFNHPPTFLRTILKLSTIITFGFDHVQVLVFGSIYARSFLRSAPQKPPTLEIEENRSLSPVNRSSSPMKENPWLEGSVLHLPCDVVDWPFHIYAFHCIFWQPKTMVEFRIGLL